MTLIIVLAAVLVFGLPRLAAALIARPLLHSPEDSPKARVALVFGAGLRRDGSPTSVLQDRVATAANLYFSRKVQKILVSGDNRFVDYNEPGSMYNYAVSLGVPPDDIVRDYAGRRTYDTCYRARHIFGVQDAILVTQDFHLPRAILLCKTLGMQVSGVRAEGHQYLRRTLAFWHARETIATLGAFWDLWIAHPVPVLGAPEPIFPPDESRDS